MNSQSAMKLVHQALYNGRLVRPNICQICDCDIVELSQARARYGLKLKPVLFAHHWKGYDYPLDVWFVCPSCNHRLIGIHDGSLSLDDAKKICRKFSIEDELNALALFYPTPGTSAEKAMATIIKFIRDKNRT